MNCSIHYWERSAFRCAGCRRPFCRDCRIELMGLSLCRNCGEEEERMMALRSIVDTVAFFLQSGRLTFDGANRLVDGAREMILELFPGKGELFDLIYRIRFNRLRDKFTVGRSGLGRESLEDS